MVQPVTEPLILDFLEWIAAGPRSRSDVMDVWRTSCPRLTIWEDAMDRDLVRRRPVPGGRTLVELTPLGRSLLVAGGRALPRTRGDFGVDGQGASVLEQGES